MKDIQYSKSPGIPHGSMDEDFLSHKKCSEWWYSTGYFNDEAGRVFGFQFTLAKVKIYGIGFHMLLTSLTDYQTGMHYFQQDTAFWGKNITATAGRVAFGDKAVMTFAKNEHGSKGHMTLNLVGKNYKLTADMNAIKPPVWQCEDGLLKMGILDDPNQTTYYYSYTNLVTSARLSFEGKEYSLKGKAWFDRQGGTYRLTDR